MTSLSIVSAANQNLSNFSDLAQATRQIVEIGRFLEHKGWAPATSGNYSVRLKDGHIAITVSGRAKGSLTEEDVMTITADGTPTDHRTPSAETLLHTGIYQAYPQCGAILHTHSPNSVIFTKHFAQLKTLDLQDYEILKAYPGVKTHETRIELPIFDNTQDMTALQQQVAPTLTPQIPAYLIRGHGIYGWGKDMAEARRVIEATEFMLECELQLRG
jgi:methylthioribulose-1-phosphate dehydratase